MDALFIFLVGGGRGGGLGLVVGAYGGTVKAQKGENKENARKLPETRNIIAAFFMA